MIFKQTFNILYEDLCELVEIRKWIWKQFSYTKENPKLEENIRNLILKSSKLIREKKEHINLLKNYLIKYSVFNLNEIGPILVDIISKVEGIEYSSKYLKKLESFAKREPNSNINRIQFFYEKKDGLIKNIYSLLEYDLLKHNDMFRPLGNEEIIKNNKLLKLYISNSCYFKIINLSVASSLLEKFSHSLIYSITEFDYINSFLEYVIDYRIKKFINNFEENITIEELEMLKNKFLDEVMNQLTQETNEGKSDMVRELSRKHQFFCFQKQNDYLYQKLYNRDSVKSFMEN